MWLTSSLSRDKWNNLVISCNDGGLHNDADPDKVIRELSW